MPVHLMLPYLSETLFPVLSQLSKYPVVCYIRTKLKRKGQKLILNWYM